MAFRARAKVGDQVTGKTIGGAPFSGKVVRVDRELGYQLESGKWLQTVDEPKRTAAEVLARLNGSDVKRWAESHEPGYTTHGVLAGRYVGRGKGGSITGPYLTHAFVGGKDKSPCGKDLANMSDIDERHAPSCPRCAAAVSKLKHS